MIVQGKWHWVSEEMVTNVQCPCVKCFPFFNMPVILSFLAGLQLAALVLTLS